jgi:hypothetical protein
LLRARGAAFFTLPLPRPQQPLARKLNHTGLVELTDGAGHYWAAADLFVCDHPYYTLTDRDGRFTLLSVPPGEYELFCWVRNWFPVTKERDPETGLIFRESYAAPVTKHIKTSVQPRSSGSARFTLSMAEFPVR